jgi:hypothetical protein
MSSNEGGSAMQRITNQEVSRRGFLTAASAGAVGLTLAPGARAEDRGAASCILLLLTGGPSQLDTWDLKPEAPSQVRGPFKPIATSVPGMHIGEHFPRMAALARHYAILRSVHHTAAPIHETGFQLMQTGRLFRLGEEHPHFGAVASHLRGPKRSGVPASVLLPGPMGSTGVNISHGQGAGPLGEEHAPRTQDQVRGATAAALDLRREPDGCRDRYGRHSFGRACLQARRLVETGVRFVTVNMFDTVFDRVTWDCHADGGSLRATLDDYRRTLCPMFDQAYAALLDDLRERGLLDGTLVVATGEFGRTPYLNTCGGRDHWPGVWSMLLAGGGVRGGQVVGASDALGAEPRERPVTPTEVAATIYEAIGINPDTMLPCPDGRACRVAEGRGVRELF